MNILNKVQSLSFLEFYENSIKSIDPYTTKRFDGFKPLIEEIYEKCKRWGIVPDDYLNINCTNCVSCWGCYNCVDYIRCRRCECCESCNLCWECESCVDCVNTDSSVNCKHCVDCDVGFNLENKTGSMI